MDPLFDQDQAAAVLADVAAAAPGYLAGLPERLVRDVTTYGLLDDLDIPLPEDGVGSSGSLAELLRVGTAAATHSSGPRFFHFVVGGSTPAAMAGDWVTSLLDQLSGMWTASAFATTAETVALRWLLDLFGLPASFGGVLTPSATFANLTGLACARQWWGEQHGVDIAAAGLTGLPRMPVVASGYVHPSVRKALQTLGFGRDTILVHARDDAGRADLDGMRAALRESGPAVVVASAGDFDPISDMADLAAEYGAWLHVDGAFGLFAALSPRTAHLVDGVTRADSVAADGHKWLNVPYESGFAFVREPHRLGETFGSWNAPYLAPSDATRVDYNNLGPESSRRARALPIWATLRAYGRSGYRAMVERHLDLTDRLEFLVEQAPDLELLAPAQLCVTCFRYTAPGRDLNELNTRLGQALLDDGRVYVGTTVYRGMVALRPAIVNWRTTAEDVDLLVSVIRELGSTL